MGSTEQTHKRFEDLETHIRDHTETLARLFDHQNIGSVILQENLKQPKTDKEKVEMFDKLKLLLDGYENEKNTESKP